MSLKLVTNTITAQAAKQWLSTSKLNRRISKSRVSRYAEAMRRGEWVLAQPLMFNCDGSLIDGHHRLHSVIRAGKPIDFVVISGFDKDGTFGKIDEVQPRKLAHWLQIHDEPLPDVLAPLIRYAMTDSRGVIATSSNVGAHFTPQQGIEFLVEHPELRVSLHAPGTVTTLAPRAMLCFCHWKFAQKDKSLAGEFLIDLVSGELEGDGDPVYVLRERLKGNRQSKKRFTRSEMLAIIIKAWNAARKGRRITNLKWQALGEKAEHFPEVE